MKLLTAALRKSLPPLYSTDGVPLEQKTAVCKFFDPCGRATFFVFEGEPEQDEEGKPTDDVRFFGYVVSALGPDCDSLGYFNLSELQSVRNRFGLGIERDLHFPPQPFGPILAKAA